VSRPVAGIQVEEGSSRALRVVDRIAARVVALSPNLKFAVAVTAEEREASFRLRHRAVVERGWAAPADLEDGLERDEHDADALLLVAWDGEVPVGTARFVFPAPGHLLPTEAAFAIRVEPVGQVVDAGRFVVARSHSRIEHGVLAGLLGFGWLTVRARGYSVLCSAFATDAAIRMYARMGFTTVVLAPPRELWGETRSPIRWDIPASTAGLERRWGMGHEGGARDPIQVEAEAETANTMASSAAGPSGGPPPSRT